MWSTRACEEEAAAEASTQKPFRTKELAMHDVITGLIRVFPPGTRGPSLTRTASALLLVFLLGTTGTARSQAPSALEGAWERTYLRFVLPDTTIEETFEPGARSTKILTPTHFAFGQQSEDGTEVYAGGGRYTFAGNTYIEFVEYHSSASLVGRTIPFESRREGDLWHIAGTIGRFRLEETWRRLP
jgi:hypothetical protein